MAIYRYNKYGESVEVERYECGSCRFYEFEREDKDNYCKEYGHYYGYRDHCNRWEAYDDSSSNSVCFLTTCCCKYKGLPDDCYELNIMRRFRDEVLLKSVSGKAIVEHYYEIAPFIVEKLEKNSNKNIILDEMYNTILEIVSLLEEGKEKDAFTKYVLLVYETEQKVTENS
ncbi:MAG: hypothetical protein IJ379_08835 [Lachnospiraceae bacterium]|nr:hypothetical protein [Lachnospiraceae bacterium]